MVKTIVAVVEKCVACKSCEIACAVEHSAGKTLAAALTEQPPPRPRVRIDSAGVYSYASRCMHCEDASCIAACPTGAMRRAAGTEAVFSDWDKCIGCWMCITVCPFGGVTADPARHKALKCDRCPDRTAQGLDPACVAACPTKALLYVTPEELAAHRQAAVLEAAASAAATPIDVLRSLKGL